MSTLRQHCGNITRRLPIPLLRLQARCRLCWQITTVVFISILIIEAVILVPSYLNFKRDKLVQIEAVGLASLRSVVYHGHHKTKADLKVAGERIIGNSNVVGALFKDVGGRTIVGVGRDPAATPADPMGWCDVGKIHRVQWSAAALGGPIGVTALLDSSAVCGEVIEFIARISALVLLISAFVTAVTMFILGRRVLLPLIFLRDNLVKAGESPERADEFVISCVDDNEWGDVVNDFNTMLVRIGTNIREMSAQEEKLLVAKIAAEEASRAKSEFLANMSHELRTPLNAIIGFSQLLQANPKEQLSEPQTQQVALIENAGSHLLEVINEVLDLAKIEAGKMEVDVQDLLVNEIIDGCIVMTASIAEKREIVVTHDCVGDDEIVAVGDGLRVKQVLLNLLSNAVKYNRYGGAVSIRCARTDDNMVRVSITDTGDGIPENKRAELFEPFNRLGVDPETTEGTGIGLPISRKLMELMGGRLDFAQVVGNGAKFWFELPLSGRRTDSALETALNNSDKPVASPKSRI